MAKMKWFTLKEFVKSNTAARLGINNNPSEDVKKNIELLVEKILDPLREKFGKPIIVTSGYRCKELNKAVGGAAKSQHMSGEAADIRTVEDSKSANKELFNLIIELGLPFDQLINEHDYDWVHVSYGKRNRRMILKM